MICLTAAPADPQWMEAVNQGLMMCRTAFSFHNGQAYKLELYQQLLAVAKVLAPVRPDACSVATAGRLVLALPQSSTMVSGNLNQHIRWDAWQCA